MACHFVTMTSHFLSKAIHSNELDSYFLIMEPHSKKMGTQFLSIATHFLKLTTHRKKMTRPLLSIASPFVIRRASYQNRAGPLVPMKPYFENRNVSQKILDCKKYLVSLPLFSIASRNISGLHKKTCANAANAKRVQAASPNPFLFHPVYRADALKRPHGPNAAGAGVGAEAAGDALAIIGDVAVGHAVRSLLRRHLFA